MTVDLEPAFTAVGDQALLVEFASVFSDAANEAVVALDRALVSSPPDAVLEIVPALVNLLVVFDPVIADHGAIEKSIRSLLPTPPAAATASEQHRVQVCYDESVAPDLAAVANACDLSIDAAIDAHLRGAYRVLMYGFAPGYAYLGGVPAELHVPRKPAAVRDVAASSVLIAGAQCIVTPSVMPTGWSVIGRSSIEVLRDNPEQPFLFGLGDQITFERVGLADLDRLADRKAG